MKTQRPRLLGQYPGELPVPISAKVEVRHYGLHGRVWAVPEGLTNEAAARAINCGAADLAGITLVWERGTPVNVVETDVVPEHVVDDLQRLDTGAHALRFWDRVRQVMEGSPRPTWAAITRTVNAMTDGRYSEEQLRAIVQRTPLDGLPVHEQRFVGPVDLVALHRSPLFRINSTEPHVWCGDPRLESRRLAGDPCVLVKLAVDPRWFPGLVPAARQRALALADVLLVSLAFLPVVMVGPTTTFTDAEGVRRKGVKYEIMFPLTGRVPSWSDVLT